MSHTDDYIKDLTATAYPEPKSDMHREIIDKVWREVVKPVITLEPDDWAADIGAGDGYALALFEREGLKARGINLLAEDVAKCEDAGLVCLQGDMHRLPLTSKIYSLVWMRHVLEHSPFPMLALFEARRILKPRGWLYVEVPSADTANQHGTNKNHWSLFPQSFWTELLQRAGFEIVLAQTMGLSTMAGPDQYFLWLCRKTLD